MKGRIGAGAALLALALTPTAQAAPGGVELSVLSSRADQVSGGDALVPVDAPRGLRDKLRGLTRDRARPVRLVDADRRRAARLEQIFPTGVCDYSQPDAGRP